MGGISALGEAVVSVHRCPVMTVSQALYYKRQHKVYSFGQKTYAQMIPAEGQE